MKSNFFHHPSRLLLVMVLVLVGIFGLSQAVSLGVHALVLATSAKNVVDCSHMPTPLPTTTSLKRPTFQAGMVSIEWGQQGYGHQNAEWQSSLSEIQAQTGARWLEMPISFVQVSLTSTHMTTMPTTPSPASLYEGICLAHAHGYNVFVVPLIGITTGTGRWIGAAHYATKALMQQWFDNYWQAFEPYIEAAQQAKAEQLSIGTEYGWLEQHAPTSLWNQLITRTQSMYKGSLTYDTNWSSLYQAPPSWMHNSALSKIGISEYISLAAHRADHLSTQQITTIWNYTIMHWLDTFATRLGKPIFLSEIGYRDTVDALYNPWEQVTKAPADATLQANTYDLALSLVVHDSHITGIYFWAWNNIPYFSLHNLPARTVLHRWFTSSDI